MLAFLRALREDKPRSTLLILVYLSLLLDNMLLTVVGKHSRIIINLMALFDSPGNDFQKTLTMFQF